MRMPIGWTMFNIALLASECANHCVSGRQHRRQHRAAAHSEHPPHTASRLYTASRCACLLAACVCVCSNQNQARNQKNETLMRRPIGALTSTFHSHSEPSDPFQRRRRRRRRLIENIKRQLKAAILVLDSSQIHVHFVRHSQLMCSHKSYNLVCNIC